MELATSSSEFRNELFKSLQSDGSFADWGRARLAPVDRFLSNFHKPLQRRMMISDASLDMPESGVMKLAATGEIFLVGESRDDSESDKPTERLTVLHVVENLSSGLTEYFNYLPDQAVPTQLDPIDIGKRSEGNFYISVEYVSTKSAESGDEAYQGKYLVYSQSSTPFKRNGVFELNGHHYKVVQAHIDSGFSCAIVLEQQDDMVPAIYHQIDEAGSGYDVETGELSLVTNDFVIPAAVDHTRADRAGFKYYDVFLKLDPLPMEVTVGSWMTLPDAGKVKIDSVVTDVNTQGQVHLVCEGN